MDAYMITGLNNTNNGVSLVKITGGRPVELVVKTVLACGVNADGIPVILRLSPTGELFS